MSRDIFLSDEYGWSATSGLFDWVVEFLLETVDDLQVREQLELAHEGRIEVLNFKSLSDSGRKEVLQVLSKQLRTVAESRLASTLRRRRVPESDLRFYVGHVKALALMGEDLATTGG